MQTYYGKINRIEKVNDRQNKCIFGRKGPASRKGTRMNVGGLKFFLCGVYLSHLLERPAFDQRSLKLVIVPFTKKAIKFCNGGALVISLWIKKIAKLHAVIAMGKSRSWGVESAN